MHRDFGLTLNADWKGFLSRQIAVWLFQRWDQKLSMTQFFLNGYADATTRPWRNVIMTKIRVNCRKTDVWMAAKAFSRCWSEVKNMNSSQTSKIEARWWPNKRCRRFRRKFWCVYFLIIIVEHIWKVGVCKYWKFRIEINCFWTKVTEPSWWKCL